MAKYILIIFLLILSLKSEAQETIRFTVSGISDGHRNSKQQDRDEAIMDAKLKAIEKAGVNIESITIVENFILKKDIIESKAEGVIMPGFQLIEIGYGEDGLYHVVLSGELNVIKKVATDPNLLLDKIFTINYDQIEEIVKSEKNCYSWSYPKLYTDEINKFYLQLNHGIVNPLEGYASVLALVIGPGDRFTFIGDSHDIIVRLPIDKRNEGRTLKRIIHGFDVYVELKEVQIKRVYRSDVSIYTDILNKIVMHVRLKKVKIKQIDEDFKNFLIAIKNNNVEAVKYYIEKGVNIFTPVCGDYQDQVYMYLGESGNEWLAFEYAVAYSNAEIVELLLKNGANPKYVSLGLFYDNHYIPAIYNDLKIFKLLLKYGGKYEFDNSFILCSLGLQIEAVEYLLDLGLNINYQDEFGETILMRAAEDQKSDCFYLLTKRGADLNIRDKWGRTVLYRLTHYFEMNSGDYLNRIVVEERIKLLRNNGAIQ